MDKFVLPTLYKKNSKGKIQYWQIGVVSLPDNSGAYQIYTNYGQEGGSEQSTQDLITEGKNLGKSNETTIQEQATLEAKAKWTKQIERKGYVENKEDLDKDLRPGAEPMLAHRYDKYPDKIEFPCYIQPKLDGHRCIAVLSKKEDGTLDCGLFSRQRTPITGLPHINSELLLTLAPSLISLKPGQKLILDGELYNNDYHDKFEELTGFIRSEEPKDGYKVVQYHIYDLVDESGNLTQKERFQLINSLLMDFITKDGAFRLVNTQYVSNDDELMSVFRQFRSEGYEGAILRNENAFYEGKRSYNLQKVKEFEDAEFIVSDVEDGKGKMKGHAIFVCQTEDMKTFRAKMKGSMDVLAEIFQNKEQYIGKSLTVMFQGRTSDNIPRFPVGLRIRKDV